MRGVFSLEAISESSGPLGPESASSLWNGRIVRPFIAPAVLLALVTDVQAERLSLQEERDMVMMILWIMTIAGAIGFLFCSAIERYLRQKPMQLPQPPHTFTAAPAA